MRSFGSNSPAALVVWLAMLGSAACAPRDPAGPQAPSGGTGGNAVAGIYNTSPGLLTVLNSTISNNSANGSGGGVYAGGPAVFYHTTIAGNLGASTDQSTWIITAFVVANGIGVPITGWLMNRYGVVKIFVLSILGFTITSLL